MIKLFNNNKQHLPQQHQQNADAHNPRRIHTILSPDDLASGKKPKQWKELEISGGVRNLSPQLWSMTYLTSLYLNDNHLQRLPGDIGRLTMLRHLDLSHNKLRTIPPQIGELTMLRELLLNNNYLRSLPFEMGKLFQIQKLSLKSNPLNNDLLQIYHESGGVQKLITYLLDNLCVMYPAPKPAQRPWILMEQPTTTGGGNGCMFTVMCYNVLCDKYASRQLYGYCPSWALNWEYRRIAIMNDLKSNSADIIALQEVETEQYHNYFLQELKQEGYEGIFSPKSRAKTMTQSERKYVDGCAIFYRTSKFSLISEHLIEFNQLAMANAEGSDDMLNRVMTKDNIALAALLQIKNSSTTTPGTFASETNSASSNSSTTNDRLNDDINKKQQMHQKRLLVCTAHMYWDPQFCDVKIIQTIMLTHELQAIANEAARDLFLQTQTQNSSSSNGGGGSKINGCGTAANADGGDTNLNLNSTSSSEGGSGENIASIDTIPLILCGDFNSLPESSVVEFLNNGSISADHRDFKKLAYKDCLRKICNSSSSALPTTITSSSQQQNAQSQNQSQTTSQYSTTSSATGLKPTTTASNNATPPVGNEDDQSVASKNSENNFNNKINNAIGTSSSTSSSTVNSNRHDSINLVSTSNSSSSSDSGNNSNNDTSNVYTHPFNIQSAYSGEGQMAYTNYTFSFKGVIDYIFYSKNLMSVLGVSGFDKSWLEENNITGLPHPYFPSDHLPLCIELEILPTPRNAANTATSSNSNRLKLQQQQQQQQHNLQMQQQQLQQLNQFQHQLPQQQRHPFQQQPPQLSQQHNTMRKLF